jgi:BetI-type transcriptional repressor, C-terminal
LFVIEMGVESTRNPRIAEIYRAVDRYCQDCFLALFQRLKDEGRISPVLEIPALAQVFNLMGEGLFWRRAVDPDFDARTVLPAMTYTLRGLLNPTEASVFDQRTIGAAGAVLPDIVERPPVLNAASPAQRQTNPALRVAAGAVSSNILTKKVSS